MIDDIRKSAEEDLGIPVARMTDLEHLLERCRAPPLDKGELCPRCSELCFEDRIDRIFSEGESAQPIHFIADMAVIDFSCSLCWFLQRITPGYEHHIRKKLPDGQVNESIFSSSVVANPKSVDFSSPGIASRWLRFSICICLQSHSFTLPGEPSYPWPKDSQMVNLDILKGKFELCKTEHRAVCGARKLPTVSGLLLINCETMKREVATADMEYVALSYVWGPAQQRIHLNGENLSIHLLPRTIRDAANLTLQLGFKYLWVDQVCINQDGAHKMDQIRQMHHIYRNSEITIIAAAGDHSNYGIPGFPGMPRLPQICCKIGDHLYTEKKLDQVVYVKDTPWNHRGWTFQEGVMSRRAFFFTDREAWFSCACIMPVDGSEFSDTACYPYSYFQGTATSRKQEAAKNPFLPPCTRLTSKMLEYNSTRMFKDLVENYSARDLTVRDDVINAFSGILGMFEQSNPPVHHIWGSPILLPHHISSGYYLPLKPHPKNRVSKPQNPSLEGFLRGLCFNGASDVTLVRRPGFPSWSWTGWIGRIYYEYLDQYDDGHNPDTGVSIAVERADGTVLSWAEFEELAYLKKDPEQISQFIHVQAWTMTVKLENGREPFADASRLHYVTQKKSLEEVFHVVDFINQDLKDLTTEELHLVTSKTYTAILMSDIQILISRRAGYFMLVETKKDHAERVGILRPASILRWWDSEEEDSKIRANDGKIEVGGMKLQWKGIRLG